MTRAGLRLLLGLLLGLLLAAGTALAQVSQVTGYIKGPKGEPVPNAAIGFDRLDYKLHAEVKTDKTGYYQIYSLLTGDYSVSVTVDGKVREKKDFYHADPGRQQLPLTFLLKGEGAGTPAAPGWAEVTGSKAVVDAVQAARKALEGKQFDEAIESLNAAAAVDAKQAAVWGMMLDAYLGASRAKPATASANLEKARTAFSHATELAPADPVNFNNFALFLASAGKPDEARGHLEKAVALDPAGKAKYSFNMGVLLLNQGQAEAAIGQFHDAVTADPKYAEAQYQYGVALAGKAAPDASGKMVVPAGTLEALRAYLELSPGSDNAQGARDMLAMFGGAPPAKGKKK